MTFGRPSLAAGWQALRWMSRELVLRSWLVLTGVRRLFRYMLNSPPARFTFIWILARTPCRSAGLVSEIDPPDRSHRASFDSPEPLR